MAGSSRSSKAIAPPWSGSVESPVAELPTALPNLSSGTSANDTTSRPGEPGPGVDGCTGLPAIQPSPSSTSSSAAACSYNILKNSLSSSVIRSG